MLLDFINGSCLKRMRWRALQRMVTLTTWVCVFGLGNRQYEHFNRMGKTTNASLERLGATRVVAYGEGDDDGNLEEDFENWKTSMWPVLTEKYLPLSAGFDVNVEM